MDKILKEYNNYYDFSSNKYMNITYYVYKREIDDNDYLETLIIEDNEIDIFMDDNGQCYYVKYTDAKGRKQEWSCGTYNSNYLDDAIAIALSINRAKNK